MNEVQACHNTKKLKRVVRFAVDSVKAVTTQRNETKTQLKD